MVNNPILLEALSYADRGWKVFPLHGISQSLCTCKNPKCQSAAKHPLIKDWQNSCTNDSETIRHWWDKWPNANVGLATGGKSGFFVLDIDPRHGGKESFQNLIKKNGIIPKTLTSATGGGGFHLFFKEPEITVSNRANLLPGLDVRGDGGYIVAPPSFHRSGQRYQWLKEFKDSPIADSPNWLLEFSLGKYKNRCSSKDNKDCIKQGQRNDFLFREAGKLRRSGFDTLQIEQEISHINFERCVPPLSASEVKAICSNISRYPSGSGSHVKMPTASTSYWEGEPKKLELKDVKAPVLKESLIPELLRPWIMDISERMQVTPEFVFAPALVAFSSIVGRKIGMNPKQHDDWLVVPNLWGAIVARPGYFKSPTISEAMKPLEMLSERARMKNEADHHEIKASQMITAIRLEALKDFAKKTIKEADFEKLEAIKSEIADIERENEAFAMLEQRFKTNDATVEKVARLLNENPNGLLLLRDELNGWLQTLNKAGREGDREFYLEAWNGFGSYTVDRVGSGTLHVPALCLSVFGGIQPGKLQTYVEKTMRGAAEDDGLLQRFQLLIYPELSPTWKNIDRAPNIEARKKIYNLFDVIDNFKVEREAGIRGVRFCDEGQELFNSWRHELEARLRSKEIGCLAFESHLAKYRSLMPSLALLFWLMENPNNIAGDKTVSLDLLHN